MNTPKPTRQGKFLAFFHKEHGGMYLMFDDVDSTDGKPYWHREGGKDPFFPIGFIENPFKRSAEHIPTERKDSDKAPEA